MSPVEIALHIKANPIFERLSARQLMDLARLVREESYDTGAAIFREGDQGSCMYLIVEGEVGILKGEEEIAHLGERDFFGELALFEGVQRTATVVARTPVRLLRLERQELLALIEELPAIAIGICQSLSRRVRDTSNRAVAR
jgi:CRP-like cAMP-binding protein